jgi:enterochelin esterase family protein
METVESQALKGNPLGDPHIRQLPIYLPAGYQEGSQRYPVVYLLAGFTSSGLSFLNYRAWELNIQQRMDRLIERKRCRPMILAMPDCFTRLGGSQYLNSSATGSYADYLLELVEHVDEHFRTLGDRHHRAIAGKSSGGYGAMVTAMRHPELFAFVADHSGDKYFELCYKPEFPELLRAVEHLGRPLEEVLADPATVRPRGKRFHVLMNAVAMSACYSPNPQSSLGFDFPVDLETGELREDVWQRWLAHDPIELLEGHQEALQGLGLLYFDCGRRDQYNIQYGCRIMHQRLANMGVDHRYEEFDDDHHAIEYRYDVSLSQISQAMDT